MDEEHLPELMQNKTVRQLDMRRHTGSVRIKQVRRQKSTTHVSEKEELGQVLSQHMAQLV